MSSQSIATFRSTSLSVDILVPYLFLHVVCLGVIWTGVTWRGVALCLASYLLRGFGLGVGYHRYFAHRSFKTSRALQFLLAVLGTLSIQRGVLWWAETHRHHHRCADKPDDIHSPAYKGFLYAHSGWFIDRRNRLADHTKVSDLSKFPELVMLDDPKFYFVPIALYAFGIYYFFGWSGLLWGFAVSTVLLWHVTHWIQSMSHTFGGYRRCASNDNSRNHWLLGLFTWGEFHNNHHAYPSSCRQGFAWWEIDFGFYVLKVLSWFGLVWDLRTPPENIRRASIQHAAQ